MFTLERGRTRATIAAEYGGRIAQLEVERGGAWLPLLYAPDVPLDERDPASWGCFAMVPWPNRIADARFTFEGAEHLVPANAPPHAIHGLGTAATWRVEEQTGTSCVLSLAFADAWPFGGYAVQRIELRDDGIDLTLALRADERSYPAGAGWHPWFRRDVGGANDAAVTVAADQVYELNDMIPTGRLLPVDERADLRRGASLGDRRLDDCYPLASGDMRIAWASGLTLNMHNATNITHAVVFTPEQAFCVEPQTCSIDAFNLVARGVKHSGVHVVAPGAPLIVETSWRWREERSFSSAATCS